MIKQMINIFSLNQFLKESADDLPLGFKQRLALSCAVMHHPEVLFLDEPTSGVDPITRREFWTHINGLVEKGVTVVVTTHFMDEAEYCDRIGLVYRSQLIKVDTPDALKLSARTKQIPNPTLEDAFIQLIEQYETTHEQ
jgi:ABC-2 type transport system ATP-binding protein